MIALAVATPVKQPAKFVFTEFLNSTGWESVGLVVILGLLQSAFTIIGTFRILPASSYLVLTDLVHRIRRCSTSLRRSTRRCSSGAARRLRRSRSLCHRRVVLHHHAPLLHRRRRFSRYFLYASHGHLRGEFRDLRASGSFADDVGQNALGLPGATFCMLLNLLSLFLAMV